MSLDEYDENCDECDGRLRVWDEDNQEYIPCKCVIQERLKSYLDPIGKIEKPPEDVIEFLDKVDEPLQDLWINVNGYDIPVYNGIIAYMLKSVFPTDYTIDNICAMHSKMRDEHTFSELFDKDDPLFILTAGLDEEFEGWDENREQIHASYANTAKQLISRRVRFGLPTWLVDRGSGYRKIHDKINDYGFKQVMLKQYGEHHMNGSIELDEDEESSNKAI